MNPEIKAAWTAALRDPATIQTTGTLTRLLDDPSKVANCCLGVLCELAVAQGVIQRSETVANGFPDDFIGYVDTVPRPTSDDPTATAAFTETGVLPLVVRQWAGLSSSNPMVDAPDAPDDAPGRLALAKLNDGPRLPFATLADLIDAQL